MTFRSFIFLTRMKSGTTSPYIVYLFIIILILQCDNKERYYRPDLTEELCAVGLVDIDDTLSYDICADLCLPVSTCCYSCWVDSIVSTKKISFEKSYQAEFSTFSDFLREFTFRISNGEEDMFVYNNDEPARNTFIEIPAEFKFESGKKYYFHASEKESPAISAECIVPDLPPELYLESLKTEFSILDLPKEGCYTYLFEEGVSTYIRRFAEIKFSFSNNNPESYYALFLVGSTGDGPPREIGPGQFASNFLNYELLETNTEGFFYPFSGCSTIQHYCRKSSSNHFSVQCMTDILKAYFIDGSRIPDGTCTMKIYVQWDNVQFIPSFIKYFQVRIMSLPKEAYLFYKSLYTYKMERDDPFGELININGNVSGGNGIIALCRSRDLIVYTGQTGGMYDPFF